MPPIRVLQPGDQFGNYRLDEALGGGGMGVVWRATDLRLGRSVAMKFLPDDFVPDDENGKIALERFRREARTASGLNHPNICVVHDVGEETGRPYLVMELLAGKTLRQLLQERPLKIREILALGIQVADALDAAHGQGVTHRDIKPANIFVLEKPDGQLQTKLLDFGLAKRDTLNWDSATLTAYRTDSGVAIGTAAYMSPEQALGQGIDGRSDLFSFGMVLYEMATRVLPFRGATSAALFDAILNKAPASLLQANPEAPAELERIILKLLEKDPDLRYQSASELRSDLTRLKRDLSSGTTQSRNRVDRNASGASALPFWSSRPAQAVFGLFVLGLVLAAGWLALRSKRPLGQMNFEGASFRALTESKAAEFFPQVGPDGRTVVYASQEAGNWDVFVRDSEAGAARNLTADSKDSDSEPALSPDGMQVAFRSERDGGGIFLVDLQGGAARKLSALGHNPAWSPDGSEIVCATEGIVRPEDRYTAASQLWAVRVDNGARRLVSNGDAVQPAWSPNGDRVAFWASKNGQRDLFTVRSRPRNGITPEPVAVTNDAAVDWNPVWSPDGNYLYFLSDRSGLMGMYRVRMDQESGERAGELEAVRLPVEDVAHISFSRDGRRLAFVEYRFLANLYRARLEPGGEVLNSSPEMLTQGVNQYTRPDLSPNGLFLAFNSQGKRDDLFVLGTDGSGFKQLTDDVFKDRGPRWSPDGKQLAFFSNRSGRWEIWTYQMDNGLLTQITRGAAGTAAWPVWSPDGKRLVFSIFGRSSFWMDAGRKWNDQNPQSLPDLDVPDEVFAAWHWSPDGTQLAGFTQRKDGTVSGITSYEWKSNRFTRLSSAGQDPVWLKDSKRLLYVDEGKVWLLDTAGGAKRIVLRGQDYQVERRGFALSRDDQWIYFSGARTESEIWLGALE